MEVGRITAGQPIWGVLYRIWFQGTSVDKSIKIARKDRENKKIIGTGYPNFYFLKEGNIIRKIIKALFSFETGIW